MIKEYEKGFYTQSIIDKKYFLFYTFENILYVKNNNGLIKESELENYLTEFIEIIKEFLKFTDFLIFSQQFWYLPIIFKRDNLLNIMERDYEIESKYNSISVFGVRK